MSLFYHKSTYDKNYMCLEKCIKIIKNDNLNDKTLIMINYVQNRKKNIKEIKKMDVKIGTFFENFMKK